MKTSETALHKIEWAVAILVTAFSVALHFMFLSHAGGLWRDEAAAINVAEMPSIKDIWHNLYFELFPISWFLVARFWWGLGLGSDFGFRVLGFLTGMLVLGAMWFTARCFKSRVPLFSLLLIGLNPLVIVYGDSMRAWGWGLCWITLEFGLAWQVVEQPTRWKVLCASVVAIAAVQSTYYNSLLLFVICTAGFLVAMQRGNWKRGGLLLGIGAVAGSTTLPYLKFFRWGEDHYSIIRQNYDLHRFNQKLWNAVSGWDAFSRDIVDVRIWWVLLLAGIFVAVTCQFLPEHAGVRDSQKDLLLFSFLTLVFAVPVFFFFFHRLRFPTAPWYYLPLMMIGALSLDAIFSVCANWKRATWVRLAAVLGIFCITAAPVFTSIKIRMTNMDLVAEHLNRASAKIDFVVLYPFNDGISFGRYYAGPTRRMCLPEVDQLVHRYDILKELILRPDRNAVIQSALDNIEKTLKSGGNVWVASGPEFDSLKFLSAPPPPAYDPDPQFKRMSAVMNYWENTLAFLLQQHAAHKEIVPIASSCGINPFEDVQLIKYSGWRD